MTTISLIFLIAGEPFGGLFRIEESSSRLRQPPCFVGYTRVDDSSAMTSVTRGLAIPALLLIHSANAFVSTPAVVRLRIASTRLQRSSGTRMDFSSAPFTPVVPVGHLPETNMLLFCAVAAFFSVAADPSAIAAVSGMRRSTMPGFSMPIWEDSGAECVMIPPPAQVLERDQQNDRDWWVCKNLPTGTAMPGSTECVEVFFDGEYTVACSF